jgi:hypothetical protein
MPAPPAARILRPRFATPRSWRDRWYRPAAPLARIGAERVLKQLRKDHGLKPIRPAATTDQQLKSDNAEGVEALAAMASLYVAVGANSIWPRICYEHAFGSG